MTTFARPTANWARLRAEADRPQPRPRVRAIAPQPVASWPANVKRPAFYVPANLDPGLFDAGNWPFVCYFLNLIRWKFLCWKGDENGAVSLKREYLRRVIPDDVLTTIRRQLVGRGVIRHSDKYAPGQCAQSYEIAEEFRQTRRVLCDDIRLAKRIATVYDSRPLLPVHRQLEQHLQRLEFDMPRAARIIQVLEPEEGSPMSVADYRRVLMEMAYALENGDVEIDAVDRFGRVHTPITRLPKELRCCLSFDGWPLVSLDLANSQPLMAGIVAAAYYRNRFAATRLKGREFRDETDNPYHKRMPAEVVLPADRPDLTEYLALCQSGQIYESLAGKQSRDDVKIGLLTAFYSKNSLWTPLKQLLDVRYPSIGGMLRDLKRRNYQHAAHLMQNTEATIFIAGICQRIFDTLPSVPVVTIHDSILTIPSAVQSVRQAMFAAFDSLGLQPTIKVSATANDDPIFDSKMCGTGIPQTTDGSHLGETHAS